MRTRPMAFSMAVLLAAALAGCNNKEANNPVTGGTGGGGPAPAGTLRIAVIPKGTTHEYWKSIHAGAIKAQQDLKAKGTNIEILWKGPLKEDDRNGQVDVVQTFQTQQVNGIVLAPLDSTALVAPTEAAVAAGIPVVIIDSSLNSTKPVSVVATDNHKGGELAAQRLIQVMGGKGKALMLRYQRGSASTEQREAGFLDGLKKAPGITLVSSDQFAGATVDSAYQSAQNVLSRFGSQVDGIFTPNESSTLGMLRALDGIGKAGKVKFVGFDASTDLVTALQAKQIDGLVVQNPFKMGDLGVTTLVQAIQKQKVEPNIDTGVTMVTLDNIKQPDVDALLHPPLDQYLK